MGKKFIRLFGTGYYCENYSITRWGGDHILEFMMPPRKIRIDFENGYTLSIIADGYGASEGLYEAALIDRETNEVVPGLTEDQFDDVVGYLTMDGVKAIIEKVMNWPRKEE